MAGSVWHIFAASTTASAQEVNENYEWSQGDVAPHSNGVLANDQFNLGTTTAYWKGARVLNYYGNTYNDTSGASVIGGVKFQGLFLNSTIVLSATTTDIYLTRIWPEFNATVRHISAVTSLNAASSAVHFAIYAAQTAGTATILLGQTATLTTQAVYEDKQPVIGALTAAVSLTAGNPYYVAIHVVAQGGFFFYQDGGATGVTTSAKNISTSTIGTTFPADLSAVAQGNTSRFFFKLH